VAAILEKYEVDFIEFTLTNGACRYKKEMSKEKLIQLLKKGMVTVRSVKLIRNTKKD